MKGQNHQPDAKTFPARSGLLFMLDAVHAGISSAFGPDAVAKSRQRR